MLFSQLADELQQLSLFAEDSREAIEWIAERMAIRELAAGTVFIDAGDPVSDFLVILNGEIHHSRPEDQYGTVFVRRTGQALGVLPFSRMKVSRGRGRAVVDTRLAVMESRHLRELVYRAPCVAQKLVSEMTDRTRESTQMDEQAAKLQALGKLSAGLAHELNNPAAAVGRSAARLRELWGEVPPSVEIDALERADREEAMEEWLRSQGMDEALAGGLVEAGVAPEGLTQEELRRIVRDREIGALTREIEEAAGRISELIHAVKSYTYMDQTPTREVDLVDGLEVTLRIFQHRLKQGVVVRKDLPEGLPLIQGNGSELNQVWTNLIDNALDAMEAMPAETRVLSVRACGDTEAVTIEITDNGPGIPEAIQSRIFEPFFTTKGVGDGTGLGLDMVRRIIRGHEGTVRVESRPGRTMFAVRLPIRRAGLRGNGFES
jgi:signal transduction histidine kinase